MRYSNILTASLSAALLLSAPLASAHEVDDKDHVKETHDLSGFSKIEVVGIYKLDVQVGGEFSVKTSGKAKDVEHMDIYVKNGTLVLGTDDEKKSWKMGRKNNNHGIHAVITLPALNSLEVAGIATGEIAGIDSDRFDVDVAGISDLTLSGRCGTLEMDQAGIGKTDASELKCEDVNVDLAGMGELKVYASNSVDADAAGMGQIEVYGKPDKVSTDKTFMSSVKIK
jgi:hypothetical protein